MSPQEQMDAFEKNEQQRRQAALDVLTNFVSNYAPASDKEADTFFRTSEIVQSIEELTGVELAPAEIFETMISMNYQYKAVNGLDFNWMLKKD